MWARVDGDVSGLLTSNNIVASSQHRRLIPGLYVNTGLNLGKKAMFKKTKKKQQLEKWVIEKKHLEEKAIEKKSNRPATL